ncbi:LysE family translocator [Shewanella avicenniae]|uniref:LysE family translocator n=1 Tax=Shewanella avicenniae TaxID=2814294 RepID=A0ABX7QMH6_9GAMM|nr:LysE family translocator [Shewanella avicenniae]QSX32227.1 LysE family translocator [Shewanella avicenniae]
MLNLSLLSVFIPTFLLVSATPGMCMTLAMTLGMQVGLRRTLWMMLGEVVGVALVAIAAAVGVAAVMVQHPTLFQLLKWLGGAYLIWVGIGMWRSPATLGLTEQPQDVRRSALISQGFITAIANPKGWAFMISLLPPFIDSSMPMTPQLSSLIVIIMLSELLCMTAYATGGKGLRAALLKGNKVQWLNRSSGALMMLVGVWLALD